MKDIEIVVLGSSNTDMVIKATHLPALGETVLGGEFHMIQGGKGANQAVAVARSGSKVSFITKIGNDIFGQQALNHYQKEGIRIDTIFKDLETPSGIALIAVDENGENCILVAPGANAKLSPKDLLLTTDVISKSTVLLMQLEIPIETIEQAIIIASKTNTKIILNTAPARPLTENIFKWLDVIVLNASEAQYYTNIIVEDTETARLAAEIISQKCSGTIIITMGAKGAFIKEDTNFFQVSAEKVNAIDTTAAGDTYCGVLASAIAKDIPIIDAVVLASKAAAISVTRMGAQTSIPHWHEYNITSN